MLLADILAKAIPANFESFVHLNINQLAKLLEKTIGGSYSDSL